MPEKQPGSRRTTTSASGMVDSIDEWRKKNWGQLPCCAHCGDPVIYANTEDWAMPMCFDCWGASGSPPRDPREREEINR